MRRAGARATQLQGCVLHDAPRNGSIEAFEDSRNRLSAIRAMKSHDGMPRIPHAFGMPRNALFRMPGAGRSTWALFRVMVAVRTKKAPARSRIYSIGFNSDRARRTRDSALSAEPDAAPFTLKCFQHERPAR
jgi:hypothetical protein